MYRYIYFLYIHIFTFLYVHFFYVSIYRHLYIYIKLEKYLYVNIYCISIYIVAGKGRRWVPAELPGVVHIGPGLDVAFVRVVDGGGPGVGPAQDEDQTIEAHGRRKFVI